MPLQADLVEPFSADVAVFLAVFRVAIANVPLQIGVLGGDEPANVAGDGGLQGTRKAARGRCRLTALVGGHFTQGVAAVIAFRTG